MPWKPEVFVEGKWSRNSLVFATQDEAERNARDLFMRWTMCSDSRAVEEPNAVVNYRYTPEGHLIDADKV
jgi:hypothetical protein